ncbi:MAG TPA: FKBP-type peptidyl-prolyl cis-trans isomerase [Terriglobales bacterium]|nr:FKBP-type peptidyl-prolyl cis-trans isomerase [Terriglobales bacterium]
MHRSVFLVLLLACTTFFALAQTKPDNSSPTKVTGKAKTMLGGLEYWDIKEGTGPAAKLGQRVTVQYTGWLTNGKKFDSSWDRGGQPFTVQPLGDAQVIKGWNEGLVGMKVGGKRQLRIPPELAYGDRGAGNVIPPNATLIFDIDVVSIQ